MKFIQIGWSRALLVTLLVSLLFFQVHVFFIRPQIQPAGAKLLIDGEPVRNRYGSPVSLSFGSHDVEVLPPDDTPKEVTALPYNFTISPLDLITGRFRETDALLWTPLYLLSLSRESSDLNLTLRRTGGFFEGIEERQQFKVKLAKDGALELLDNPLSPGDNPPSPGLYVPMGQYCIQEGLKGSAGYSEFAYTVKDGENVPRGKNKGKSCTGN